MERKLDEIAKNHLLDRNCDNCAHIEYENVAEVCHRGSGDGIPSYITFPIPEERTCNHWKEYIPF